MILSDILAQYQAASGGWYAILFPIANNLFLSLLVLELLWIGIRIGMQGEGIAGAFGQLLWAIITVGFAYVVLLTAHIWIPAVINSFMGAGSQVAGGVPLDPSAVMDQGITLAGNMLGTLGVWGTFRSPVNTLVVGILVILVLIAFALIAFLLLYVLVQAYIVVGGGILLLGFGGSRWTRPIMERALSYAVSVGAQLFVTFLIIGIAGPLTQTWADGLIERSGEDVSIYFEVLVGAIVYLGSVWRIPQLAGDMMMGIVSFTMHEGERMYAAAPIPHMAGSHGGGGRSGAMQQIASAVQAGGQKLLAAPSGSGGMSGGNSGGSGQGSSQGGNQAQAPLLNQFRNAGQGSQKATPQAQQQAQPSSGAGPTSPPNLSFMKDGKAREALERFGNRGKEES